MRISDWISDVCSSDLVPDYQPRGFVDERVDRRLLQQIGTVQHRSMGDGFDRGDAHERRQLHVDGTQLIEVPRQVRSEARLRFALEGFDLSQGSEERRVGTACVHTCWSRWSPDHYSKKIHNDGTVLTSNIIYQLFNFIFTY